jgi:hypothetical protein
MKNILSWLLLLFGEAIIIAAFILFGGRLTDEILVLNIVVSTVIYGVFFIDALVPWIGFGDKSQRKVGSLGVRWFVSWMYAAAAIATMLVCYHFDCSAALQLIIHCALIFFLILGFMASLHSGDKVQEVYQQETLNRSGIVEMKKAMTNLRNKMNDTASLPEYFTARIHSLEEGLRFISPSNNAEAHELENAFSEIVNDISFAVSDFQMNEEAIESKLKKLEGIYQRRKSIYSN